MSLRDTYSNFGYFTAFAPQILSDAQGSVDGTTIDLRGYGAATIVFGVLSYASAGAQGAADITAGLLYHGLASAAGVSAWSLVPGSLLIHSVYGGYDSTAETGIFFSLMSKTDLTTASATGSAFLAIVGYKGDNKHRYLRVTIRNSDAASAAWGGGFAILGEPANWPVNDTI